MTPLQIKSLHVALGQVKKLRPEIYDDAWWRMVLRNIGHVRPDSAGHVSAKALSHAGFEDVMAFLETHGFRDPAGPETRWRDIARRRLGFASSRQVKALRDLAGLQRYDLRAACLRMSDGAADAPERLTPCQAHKLIEMFKSVVARDAKKPAGAEEGGASAGIPRASDVQHIPDETPVNAEAAR